jgi:hypothetical protein
LRYGTGKADGAAGTAGKPKTKEAMLAALTACAVCMPVQNRPARIWNATTLKPCWSGDLRNAAKKSGRV